jgi:hypothetical protein
MNKPATKEPSMDEILSSIRQIIADDSGPAPHSPMLGQLAPAGVGPEAEPERDDDAMSGFGADEAPLALLTNQIVGQPPAEPAKWIDFAALMRELPPRPVGDGQPDEPQFVDPEDISFASEPEREPPATAPAHGPVAVASPVERLREAPALRPQPTPAQAAPMPDLDLSRDIAEQLLEPATGAAVRANFAKLNNLGLGNSGLTIEDVIREMLRPMLKEWLDEHLPTVVERMVEREISRISRGVE